MMELMLMRCRRGAARRGAPRAGILIVAATTGLLACGDDQQPVDIPYESVEPPAPEPAPEPTPAPEPSASNTARPSPGSYKGRVLPSTGRLSSCCGALSVAAKTKNAANASMYTQAFKVCRTQVARVRASKLSVDEALSMVRLSLLGSAPAACR